MEATQRRPITRNRELLACTECRRKKLKCDRNVPCGSCVKRNAEDSCTYQRFARGERERERRLEAEDRLEHLEGLVQQLAASQTAGAGDAFQASSVQQTNGLGDAPTAVFTDFQYSGSTHWSAMLEDIDELRFSIAWEDNYQEDVSSGLSDDDGTSFLFGAAASLSFQQILIQYLPPRQESDRLVAAYFRLGSMVAPFIHTAQFQRRYQRFWTNPQGSPPLWTSILFSMFHIASITVARGNAVGDYNGRYSLAAAQCLASGRYYRPQTFAVESLLLFVQARCFRSFDVSPEMGVLMANVIRLATSSGYHRDPDIFDLSAFAKEMRRRTWSLCIQLDMLISFALGLPSNVPFGTHDTPAPRNLRDADFDEETIELPPVRPDSEPTNILFYIVKHRLMTVFEKILRHSLSTEKDRITGPDELEAELNSTYSSLPEILKPKPVTESIVDSSSLVVTRLCVLFLYEKCRCVLHRRHAVGGRAQSLKICYEASSSIVNSFLDIFPHLQPLGQFEDERWFNSTLTWHDFLLGAMVLCLVLCVNSQNLDPLLIDYASSMNLLRRVKDVCVDVAYKSKHTIRVQKLVQVTLARLDQESGRTGQISITNGNLSPNILDVPSAHDRDVVEEMGNGTTNASQDTWKPPPEDMWPFSWKDASPLPIDDISWTYLEQYLALPNDDVAMNL